ncbi:hypothetical protein pb186bvf_011850 [Paramecium bursaria]
MTLFAKGNGVAEFQPHNLRKSRVIELSKDLNIFEISQWLGHKKVKISGHLRSQPCNEEEVQGALKIDLIGRNLDQSNTRMKQTQKQFLIPKSQKAQSQLIRLIGHSSNPAQLLLIIIYDKVFHKFLIFKGFNIFILRMVPEVYNLDKKIESVLTQNLKSYLLLFIKQKNNLESFEAHELLFRINLFSSMIILSCVVQFCKGKQLYFPLSLAS